jgi:hypothetical protein
MMIVDELRPTWTPERCDCEGQAEDLSELRRLSEEGAPGRHMLGERMLALRMHPTLSLEDMARAARLTVEDVRAIVLERWQHHLYCNQVAAEERVRRHMPA